LSIVATGRANPETVEALLDATWQMTANEAARTDALDRKASTIATFASVLIALVGTLGLPFVDAAHTWWAVSLFTASLLVLLAAVVLSIVALFPREYLTLGMDYLRRFPTWSEVIKRPEEVRGETMHGLIGALGRERETNHAKAQLVKWSYAVLAGGLVLSAVQAVTLAVREML